MKQGPSDPHSEMSLILHKIDGPSGVSDHSMTEEKNRIASRWATLISNSWLPSHLGGDKRAIKYRRKGPELSSRGPSSSGPKHNRPRDARGTPVLIHSVV